MFPARASVCLDALCLSSFSALTHALATPNPLVSTALPLPNRQIEKHAKKKRQRDKVITYYSVVPCVREMLDDITNKS